MKDSIEENTAVRRNADPVPSKLELYISTLGSSGHGKQKILLSTLSVK